MGCQKGKRACISLPNKSLRCDSNCGIHYVRLSHKNLQPVGKIEPHHLKSQSENAAEESGPVCI